MMGKKIKFCLSQVVVLFFLFTGVAFAGVTQQEGEESEKGETEVGLSVSMNQETEAYPNFGIRGRFHFDGFAGIDKDDVDGFGNGFNNRRARLGMDGSLTEDWDARIEVDFSEAGVSPNDFRVRRSFANGGRMWLGQFKVPQGLNELTSSNSITFVERTTISNIITDSRRMGVAYEWSRSQTGVKGMFYGRSIGDDVTGDSPLGGALRGVFAPQIGGGTLHLGASVAYEDVNDENILSYSDRPEARGTNGGNALIGAEINGVESTFKTGVELAYIRGPFSIEGEYLQANIDRDNADNPTISGYHIQSSYVLNGGNRSYSTGGFGGVNGAGVWEIAARYSHADLNDNGIYGGEQTNITLGVNRYITSNLRFMGNIIFVNADLEDESVNPTLAVFRAQFNF